MMHLQSRVAAEEREAELMKKLSEVLKLTCDN